MITIGTFSFYTSDDFPQTDDTQDTEICIEYELPENYVPHGEEFDIEDQWCDIDWSYNFDV